MSSKFTMQFIPSEKKNSEGLDLIYLEIISKTLAFVFIDSSTPL